jgi:hypothetical protein
MDGALLFFYRGPQMLHSAFYKTMLSYLQMYGGLSDAPFQGNPDYPAYWALFTSDPTDANSGTTEAAYGGYARYRGYRNPYHWALHDGPPAFACNSYDIAFPVPTSGAGEVITHWAHLYLAADGVSNKIVASGPIENPLTVAIGQTIMFPTGELIVQVPAA